MNIMDKNDKIIYLLSRLISLQTGETPEEVIASIPVPEKVALDQTPDVDEEAVERIYKAYPSKCPKSNRSTGKCTKNKNKIGILLREKTEGELLEIIRLYVKECEESRTYLKNFGTFLNQLPEFTSTPIVETKSRYR